MGLSWQHKNDDYSSEIIPTPFNDVTDTLDVVDSEQSEEIIDAVVSDNKPMVLRTDNLVKRYGKRTVANHVSIDVTQGEIVGLLGPNGAGKTTLVKLILGLYKPEKGHIYIDGISLEDISMEKYRNLFSCVFSNLAPQTLCV